jgi:hypothetical protein
MIVGGAYNSTGTTFTQFATGPVTINAAGGSFSISGSQLFPSVSLATGTTTFTIDSYLTLVADPDSTIQLGFAGAGRLALVPEPMSIVQLGCGTLLTGGLLLRRHRSRSPRRGRGSSRSRRRLGLATALALCLVAPGSAFAGMVYINDLGPQPIVTISGFATHSFTIDPSNDSLSFDGTYLSSAGFPSAGSSVSYSVAFLDPGQVPSDLTVITITGLANTDPTQPNVEIQVAFSGIVNGPISPDFSIPEPGGFYDIADYLRGQGAMSVPTDLSVIVGSTTVPEPPSIALAGVAALIALAVILRRHSAAPRRLPLSDGSNLHSPTS